MLTPEFPQGAPPIREVAGYIPGVDSPDEMVFPIEVDQRFYQPPYESSLTTERQLEIAEETSMLTSEWLEAL